MINMHCLNIRRCKPLIHGWKQDWRESRGIRGTRHRGGIRQELWVGMIRMPNRRPRNDVHETLLEIRLPHPDLAELDSFWNGVCGSEKDDATSWEIAVRLRTIQGCELTKHALTAVPKGLRSNCTTQANCQKESRALIPCVGQIFDGGQGLMEVRILPRKSPKCKELECLLEIQAAGWAWELAPKQLRGGQRRSLSCGCFRFPLMGKGSRTERVCLSGCLARRRRSPGSRVSLGWAMRGLLLTMALRRSSHGSLQIVVRVVELVLCPIGKFIVRSWALLRMRRGL